MVGKRSVTIVAATALLLGGGGVASGDRRPVPGRTPRWCASPSRARPTSTGCSNSYDVVEYKHVEDDGSISLNIDTTAAERAALREKGYTIGRTVEDASTRAGAAAERDATARRRGPGARHRQERRDQGRSSSRASRSCTMPGETVIQRANTFTNYAGRFLYVEAHNKGVIQTGTGNGTGRTLALSFAGADGVFGAATNMGVFRDTDPTPDVYMYHRQLIRLTGDAANIPAGR